jgi:hypothetical protein
MRTINSCGTAGTTFGVSKNWSDYFKNQVFCLILRRRHTAFPSLIAKHFFGWEPSVYRKNDLFCNLYTIAQYSIYSTESCKFESISEASIG